MYNTNILLTILFVGLTTNLPILVMGLGSNPNFGSSPRKCERITIPMCKNLPYNTTRMPNFIGHHNQAEAALRVHEFAPLQYVGCSPLLNFYLCSMFAPLCPLSFSENVPPCKSVCLTVKESCLPVLLKFNFTWPHYLECDKLPMSNTGKVCMEHPDHPYTTTYGSRPDLRKPSIKTSLKPKGIMDHSQCLGVRTPVQTRHKDFCAPICDADFLYRSTDKHTAKIWMIIWAALCLLSSMFTVFTFCLDMNRVKYPERPIIWLSFCYLWYCIPFIARGILPAELLSCETSVTGVVHLTLGGLRSPGCIFTFMLQYYFMLASSMWWLILTITWFLSAGRFMVSEALQAYASYFHAAAWGAPALATILVLTLKQVDGDELSGLCFVGSMRPSSFLWFVVLPLSAILLTGTVFFIVGFIALWKIRNAIKRDFREPIENQFEASKKMSDLGKFEKLMVRIGVFSGLYTFPAMFVIGGHIYQYLQYDEWVTQREDIIKACQGRLNNYIKNPMGLRTNSYSKHYKHYGYHDLTGSCDLQKSIPIVEIMMLRIFMSLVVGITSGVWVWSSKTVTVWKKFFQNACCRKSKFRKYPTPVNASQMPQSLPVHQEPAISWQGPHVGLQAHPPLYNQQQHQPLLRLSDMESNLINARPKKTLNKYSNLRGNSNFSSDRRSSSQNSQANTCQTAQL